jgi:hypothetical protein
MGACISIATLYWEFAAVPKKGIPSVNGFIAVWDVIECRGDVTDALARDIKFLYAAVDRVPDIPLEVGEMGERTCFIRSATKRDFDPIRIGVPMKYVVEGEKQTCTFTITYYPEDA